jgi:hypothetical protein
LGGGAPPPYQQFDFGRAELPLCLEHLLKLVGGERAEGMDSVVVDG